MMSTGIIAVASATISSTLCHGFSTQPSKPVSMWQILNTNPSTTAFQTIFAPGSRGEYMDGYSKAAMMERCHDDYKWSFLEKKDSVPQQVEEERVEMMSHLYENRQLFKYVCMVAFAEHYLMEDDDWNTSKAYETFMRQQEMQPPDESIFGGVVWDTWQQDDKLPTLYKEKGIDYVRMHCNFGDGNIIGGAAQLLTPSNNPLFGKLARAAKECQVNEMVPLILMQVPWREEDSDDYFNQAMKSLADELQFAGVECKQVILETRPPIGISAQEEEGMSTIARQELGFQTGQNMFKSINKAFQDTTIAGFCVAGGSTKGEFPTAMQDDTQNAVRQGMRSCARDDWGYDLCFWEMGAKLMLQPKVGRLWGHNGQAGRDAARELFCVNARDMADEIREVS
mmetsp:Transcript_21109/g.42243  ORF Transcript_21109/g.42243 Transcript_21109/m.42243 type:complete len:396 (-) Transcript_21109:1338-2525(-)